MAVIQYFLFLFNTEKAFTQPTNLQSLRSFSDNSADYTMRLLLLDCFLNELLQNDRKFGHAIRRYVPVSKFWLVKPIFYSNELKHTRLMQLKSCRARGFLGNFRNGTGNYSRSKYITNRRNHRALQVWDFYRVLVICRHFDYCSIKFETFEEVIVLKKLFCRHKMAVLAR